MDGQLDSLEEISHLVAVKEGWNERDRTGVLGAYRDFMARAINDPALRPSTTVDRLWHEHILHTSVYAADCEAWFGGYVHHRPCIDPALIDDISRRIGRRIAIDRAGVTGLADCGAGGPGISAVRVRTADCGAGNH